MEPEELAAWLRLLLTPGVGNSGALTLLKAFGLPQNVFRQTVASLASVVSERQADALLQVPADLPTLLQRTRAWLAADLAGRRLLTLGDPAYPQALLQTDDPPFLLYAQGAPAALRGAGLNSNAPRCIAVVGSRNPSAQGASNARQFGLALAQSGLTVVSGLALGIDGAAHEGALEGAMAGTLPTVAVVGTGLDRVYPRQHQVLAHRIVQKGLLLSEYPLGTPPLPSNFPQRNRIISGLSQGTLVVEAALASGSLITARLAAEQGREVFAIPGSIHSTQSRGCHLLIRQGAKLVENAADILEELDWPPARELQAAPVTAAQSPAHPLLDALGYDPCSLEQLQARTGMDTPSLQAGLMALELEGRISRLAGGLFQRMERA